MLSGGAPRQVGGEFLFEGGKVTWCKRMRNTRDHAEIPEVKQHLGLTKGNEENGIPSEEVVAPATTTPTRNKRASMSGLGGFGGLGKRFNERRQSWGGSRSRSRVTVEKEKAGTSPPPPAAIDEVKEEVGNTPEDALAKLEGRGEGGVVDEKAGEVDGMTSGMANRMANGNGAVVA